jgi:hypothetical protein
MVPYGRHRLGVRAKSNSAWQEELGCMFDAGMPCKYDWVPQEGGQLKTKRSIGFEPNLHAVVIPKHPVLSILLS